MTFAAFRWAMSSNIFSKVKGQKEEKNSNVLPPLLMLLQNKIPVTGYSRAVAVRRKEYNKINSYRNLVSWFLHLLCRPWSSS